MTTATRPPIRTGPLLALAAAMFVAHPVAAQDSVGDFKLQPGPTATPQAQGPVTEGEPAPRVARPAPTPAPTPTPVPAPVRTAEPPAVVIPPVTVPARVPTPAATVRPAVQPPAVRPTAAPAPAPSPTPTPQPAASASPAIVPSTPPTSVPSASPLSQAPVAAEPPAAAQASAHGSHWWRWLAAAVLLALAGAGAIALLRRRTPAARRVAVPEIERPRVPENAVAPSAEPPPPPPPAKPALEEDGVLSLALEARQLSLTLTSAALAYRVTLTNNGKTRLRGVTVAGDMISAHSSLSEAEQRANTASELKPVHEIESLAAGETTQLSGEFRLPFTRILPIRKGNAALFVPLARLRVNAADGGNGAVLLTALVGQRSRQPGAGLQPFRLDFGPRIYREVTQRIF